MGWVCCVWGFCASTCAKGCSSVGWEGWRVPTSFPNIPVWAVWCKRNSRVVNMLIDSCASSQQYCGTKYANSCARTGQHHWAAWTWTMRRRGNRKEDCGEQDQFAIPRKKMAAFSWVDVWRWKMGLHEIASVPESYINMILREVSTAMLIAYFPGREMNIVSAGVTGGTRLTPVFLFPLFSSFFFCAIFCHQR